MGISSSTCREKTHPEPLPVPVITLFISAHGEEHTGTLLTTGQPPEFRSFLEQVRILSMAGKCGSSGFGLGMHHSVHQPGYSITEHELKTIWHSFSTQPHVPTLGIMKELSGIFKKMKQDELRHLDIPVTREELALEDTHTLRTKTKVNLDANDVCSVNSICTNQICDLIKPIYDRTYVFQPNDGEEDANRLHYGIHLVDLRNFGDEKIKYDFEKNILTNYRKKDSFWRNFYRHFKPEGVGPITSIRLSSLLVYLFELGFEAVNIIDPSCRSIDPHQLIEVLDGPLKRVGKVERQTHFDERLGKRRRSKRHIRPKRRHRRSSKK